MRNWFSGGILQGLLFALLWSSASVAGKFGLYTVEPLVLFNIRFVLAGGLLLVIGYGFQRNQLPSLREFKQLIVFSAFNTALYLGLFVLALRHVAAGITTLLIALTPILISLITALWTKRRIKLVTYLSLLLGTLGVAIASYPLLNTSHVTGIGLVLLGLSMLAYSFGSVYYTTVKWELPRMVINGWQTLIAAVLILPLTLYMYEGGNEFGVSFWLSELWMIVFVSVFAVQLWLRLLKTDPVRASLWLYLCPIFGFVYATFLLSEPFSVFSVIGGVLVILALYLGQKK
ncbi:DMT family transporter [Reichenbachiella agarivorans]|uniref:DMT family transporter n=1 Tax=Reichenbachiella agarivorans TaxID=2979464 RepID=A0ABY6CQI2_9BACT|nr:DMT family transporter [Reichenbachiella agarivorans]UXP32784.1 DMT family transporter [Reichenbachiella agarivorans]